MLFIPSANINHIWKIIAGATISGDLGISAKVAPHDKDEDPQGRRPRLICIYTKYFSDVKDVVRVLGELKKLGMVETRGKPIYYKPGKLINICLCYGVGTTKLVSGVLT
jgi:hypothetical protein